jgi:hypothetical protein
MSLPPLLARPDRGAPPLRGSSSAREAVMNHPGCLRYIFAFVPVDSFRFVAPVSRIFRREYLLTVHDHSTRTLLLHAAATPRTAQLWLNDGRPLQPLAVMAARWGRLDVLRSLSDDDGGWPFVPFPDGYFMCVAAASNGHLHVLEWMLTNELAVWNSTMSNAAAHYGHVHVLQFARDRDYPMNGNELSMSATNGHLNVVIWFGEQGYRLDADTCSIAAQFGHLHILEWLRAHECHGDADTCARAAAGGHFHILQWLRANGCPWNDDTCCAAAENGHLHILQWARANGCDWDERTCWRAAGKGHLHILQWARANGCDWDAMTCNSAAYHGHLHILQWARANGCPWDAAVCFQVAREWEHAEIVEWMIVTLNM